MAKDTTLPGFLWLCSNRITNNRAVHRKPDAAQTDHAPELTTQVQSPCVLTAGEGQGAGMRIHGEVMQLQLAFCIDGEPMKKTSISSSIAKGSKVGKASHSRFMHDGGEV